MLKKIFLLTPENKSRQRINKNDLFYFSNQDFIILW